MVRITVVLLLLALLPSTAFADKRVALVIGNSTYKHAGELTNPKNDAKDMAAALKKLGFQVIDGFDLDKAGLDRKVRDFAVALSGAEAGVFFYAGHGLQVGGKNYLVPVDAELTTAEALEFEMVQVDVVHRIMEGKTNTNVLFLDACRNNPLSRNLARAMGTRSAAIGRGLAPVESGVGTLISFSTQPGNVALDGSGRNSPFAGALVKRLATSNDDLSALLIDVRNDVRKETEGKQVPWEHSALTGRFYFNAATPVVVPVTPGPTQSQTSEALQAWKSVENSTDVRDLEAFRKQYGKANPFYDRQAERRIEELKKQQVAIAAPPSQPAPSKPAQPAVAIAPTLPLARCDGVEAQVGNERRCLKPGAGKTDWFKDCPTCPEMVVAPAGRFTMGSPAVEPEREPNVHFKGTEDELAVTITKPFAVGRFAVTRGEFAAFVAATGHKTEGGCRVYTGSDWELQADRDWRNPGFSQTDRHPVVCVNWNDAKAYVAWLTSTTDKTYRLLSETEREYTTRAGSTTPFWWGSSITPKQANYDGSAEPYKGGGSKGEWRKATAVVDTFAANPWGLYNVHGNVLEWTEDCWNEKNSSNPRDGSARTSGTCGTRILRGGSWASDPQSVRSAIRIAYVPSTRYSYMGFRVARTLLAP